MHLSIQPMTIVLDQILQAEMHIPKEKISQNVLQNVTKTDFVVLILG